METSADSDGDPRTWTIDRVVYELCLAPTPQWLPNANSQYSQNRLALEGTFRQNDIDGDSLLTLEMRALKEDLGIVSYGIRNIIMKAINFFRAKSRSYQQMLFQVDNIARMQSTTFPSPQITHPRFSAVPQSPASYGIGIHPSIESLHARSPSLASGFGRQRAPPPPDPPRPSGSEPTALGLTDKTNLGADLSTTHPSKPEPSSAAESRPEQAASKPKYETQSIAPLRAEEQNSKSNGKRRIAPTFISHLSETIPLALSEEGYLTRDAVPIQDVFYCKVPTTIESDDTYRVPVDDIRQLDISVRVPSGHRRAVARLMKSFLRRGTEVLPSSGLRVIMPYDESLVQGPSSKQYFTLLLPGRQLPKVRSVAEYPELKALQLGKVQSQRSIPVTAHDAQNASSEGDETRKTRGGVDMSDLDYLLAKYPPQDVDEALPLYGDSGDEGDYDEDTWREMEEEKAEEVEIRNRPVNLTHAQVETAIDEAIEAFKHEWRETKMTAVQRRAYRHWTEAARIKNRQPKIQYFRKSKDHCLQRMIKLRREVASNTWRNSAEVKKQCQVLEVTVHQHEEYSYYSRVMLQNTPPEKPSKEALAKVHLPKQHDLEEGEEIIESEPEAVSEDDGHSFIDDNAVDDNSSDFGSIHHDPEAEEWNPENWKQSNTPAKRVPAPTIANKEPPPGTQDSPPKDTLMPDANAEDADIETDEDDIITPSRRRTVHVKAETAPQTPIFRRKVPLIIPKPFLAKEPGSSDNSDLDRTPRLPKSRYRNHGRSTAAPIDLTIDSPHPGPEKTSSTPSSDFSVHTPKLNPVGIQKGKKALSHVSETATADSGPRHPSSEDDTNLPKWDDVRGIRATDWSDIEPADTRRALAKSVYSLALEFATDLASFMSTLSTEESREKCIVEGLALIRLKDFFVTGIQQKHQFSAEVLVLLYITHCTGENTLDKPVSQIHRHQAYEDKDAAIRPFYETLGKLLRARFNYEAHNKGTKRKRDQESLSDIEMLDDTEAEIADYISTDDLEEAIRPSSHKKRKRKVEQSQEAMSQQYNDKMRIQAQEKRRNDMSKKLAMMQPEGTAESHVIINTDEPLVELHEHIAGRIKPHQVAGLQFMWREIIEDPKHQGCILAHTMGLGKTMQVVSLLVTISLCCQSPDPKVRQLIPEHLRHNKTLILAPASLLNNWEDELLMWTPQGTTVLGAIHKCDLPRAEDNIRAIKIWSKRGGVLLMGYERFRSSITNSIKDKKKGAVAFDLEQILLEVPGIVIADEAHTLKNPKSKINEYSKRFKTISRIALTGSPLNNHLEEYHTLVDWIAPGYLGTMVQFRSKYSEPIRDGLWSDSTANEKRVALRKLHVLKRDLDPKINRADITAIEKDMPSKTEFFITIPLTELQTQAYNIYVQHMVQAHALMGGGSSNARLWDWIAMLSWLCHHPAGFVTKLKERQKKDKGERIQTNNAQELSESSDEAPVLEEGRTPEAIKEDTEVDATGPMRQAMEAVLQILPDVSDHAALFDPSLSYRTVAVRRIVEKAMEAGDKTLIFSHSIPTLNYLAEMLKAMNCSFSRIDGKTKVSERQAQVKEFNEMDRYQVFLISMRAGGLGLNLQGANRVIVFDFSFNPIWEQQAIGRAYRLNQKRPVFVYRFQAGGTFEDKLFNTAVFKTQLFGRVVDKKAPRPNASKKTDMQYLFPVKEVPQEDFSESRGKDPKVLDAIIPDLGFIKSIVLTETFQKEDDERLDAEEQKAAEEEYQNERLQRDDPVAWQAKEMARLAQERKQQQQQQAAFRPPSSTMPSLPYSPANTAFPASAISGVPRSAQYSLVHPPFGREDLRKLAQPQRPPPIQNVNGPSMRGSYDDSYNDFSRLNHGAPSGGPNTRS